MSELTHVATLMKELMRLESKSNKLCNRAYKTRNEYASKDWRAYRKVHSRLKVVKKQIGYHFKLSQDTFHSIDPSIRPYSDLTTGCNVQTISPKPPQGP